ncbi:MAG: beta-lactamase family protein [Hyphomonadaceae bacterium]|nr:beta-lactamase family protein [Hyphomonadaceae bacterium]
MTRARRIAGGLLASLVLLCGGLALSGHAYILAAIRDTYLRGRLSPPMTETGSTLTRHVREIAAGTPQPWPMAQPQRALAREQWERMAAYRTAAFLVIEDGVIQQEVYGPGFDRYSRTNSNSVAKTLVGALVGIALAEGAIRSLDQPVSDYLPEFAQGTRAQLTLRHLLTMSAATDFVENYNNPLAFPARAHFGSDITRLLMDEVRVTGQPGRVHKYDSSNTALLGLVLARATGQQLSDYASERLWQPLGAEWPALWSLDHAGGVERAYCCIYATARDYARLGQLYLDQGLRNGRQLVPASYVAEAIRAAPLVDASGAKTERYGYQLWRMRHRGHEVYYAWGYQGQYIAIIPDRRMVMVRLGDGGGLTEEHYRLDLPLYLDAALEVP